MGRSVPFVLMVRVVGPDSWRVVLRLERWLVWLTRLVGLWSGVIHQVLMCSVGSVVRNWSLWLWFWKGVVSLSLARIWVEWLSDWALVGSQ